jgi:hypothetical protein
MVSLGRTFRTVRHLRPRQVVGQLVQRLRGPARDPARPFSDGLREIVFTEGFCPPSSEGRLDGRGGVALVGHPPFDPVEHGWGEDSDDALWAYSLHYHGWLNRPDCSPDLARATILAWIDEHRGGIGWEPYPTSMRLLHWLGWLHSRGSGLVASQRERMLSSMAAQMIHLGEHIETHIDGNHLWTNLAALTAVGLGVRGPLADRVVDRFAPALIRVVQDQLGPDGVHRERTPTYHCLLAEQLHMVTSLAARQRGELRGRFEPLLRAMVSATASFTHPDGDVALWGDSQRDAPVTPAGLSARTGFRIPAGDADAPEAGFHRRRWGDFTVLWNAGGIGLAHQPGHVHADAMSIEASLDDERILVDAGVGTYRIGDERRYARSTAAHNTATVGVGEPDQYELWASHRVGARAQLLRRVSHEGELRGGVKGYRSPAWHKRAITGADGYPIIADEISDDVPASVRYFLPGDFRVRLDPQGAAVSTPAGRRFRLETTDAAFTESDAPGWLGMGRPAARICLAAQLPAGGLRVALRRT